MSDETEPVPQPDVIKDYIHLDVCPPTRNPSYVTSSSHSPITTTEFMEKYRIHAMIGTGSFGCVYKCTEKATRQKYACKIMLKKGDKDDEKAKNEIEIMEQMPEHPNVVTFKEKFEDEKCFQVVMTLCDGGGLFSRKGKGEGGCFTERQAARAIKDIMEGVKFCHQNSVFHGDIKPSNIMWKDKEKSCLVLVDFGVSLKFTQGEKLYGKLAALTPYTAPEVIDKSYGKEADIWSVGVLLYQMIYGTLPFSFHHDASIGHLFGQPTKPSFSDPDYTDYHMLWGPKSKENGVDCIKQMLTREPGSRITAEGVLGHPWILMHQTE